MLKKVRDARQAATTHALRRLREILGDDRPQIYTVRFPQHAASGQQYYRVFAIEAGRLVDIAGYVSQVTPLGYCAYGERQGCLRAYYLTSQDIATALDVVLFETPIITAVRV